MEAARTIWTDERLDDLNGKVDALATEMHAEFRALRSEARSEFQAVHARLDAMQRAILTLTASISGTMIVGFAGLLASQL